MGAFAGSPVAATYFSTRKGDSTKVEQAATGPVHVSVFSYTHTAGAGTGEVNLCHLPPGRIMFLPQLSWLNASQMAATADLHLGHRAYVDEAGATVAEDDNEWLDNFDIAAGAHNADLDAIIAIPTIYNSQAGIDVYALIDTGNIEDTDTINGWIAYKYV